MSEHATIEMPLMVKLKLAKMDDDGGNGTPAHSELIITYVDWACLKEQIQAFVTENEAQIREDYL